MIADVQNDHIRENATKSRAIAEEGDNRVLFLSRPYALLHSAAVVEAAGRKWVGMVHVGPIRQYTPKQH